MSLQSKILKTIQGAYPNVVSINKVFEIAKLSGHKQSLAERKCRLLVHSGLIEAIRNEKRYIMGYKAVETITTNIISHTASMVEIKPPEFKPTQEPLLKIPYLF